MVNDGVFWKEIKAIWSCNGATDEEVKALKELIIEYKAINLQLEERIRTSENQLKNLAEKVESISAYIRENTDWSDI